jgi:RNA polymerase sigma-70 factor (ECF subfamily)
MSPAESHNAEAAARKGGAYRVDERPNERKKRFEAMYRTHYNEVLDYARRRAPEDVARDVAAETFLVAWRRLDVVPDEQIPWLIAVARRTLANHRRSARRRLSLHAKLENERHITEMLESDPHEQSDDPAVVTAFRRLPEKDQELLRLIAWEELDYAQAATALGCSRVALRIRLHRARSRFQTELQRLDSSLRSGPNPTRVTEANETP